MAKPTEQDELRAAYEALCDQYAASAEPVRRDPTDRVAKLRRRHLAEEIDAMRTHWREIGAFVGDRPVDAKGRPGIGVKVVDNDGSVPT